MKIVLIGDSIREGYDKYVKMALEGIADVYYPEENCRFTTHILRHIYEWKKKMGCGTDVDLVHWNAGLWDCLTVIDGEYLISLDHYRENVARICKVIKILFPNAKIVFATSTPCIEEENINHRFIRKKETVECYNQVACEIIRQYDGEIDDLYTLLKDIHVDLHSDQTHYYTKEGTKVIAGQVIKCIEELLNIKAQILDYDVLFAKKEDFVGM